MSYLFAYSEILEEAISFEENEIPVLTFENRNAYRNLLSDFQMQKIGNGGISVLSKDNKEISAKHIEFISDPFLVDINNKKLITEIINQLAEYAKSEDFTYNLQKLNSGLQNFILDLIDDIDVELEFSEFLDVKGLLKLYDIKIPESNYSDLLEKLLKYILLEHQVLGIECFIINNLKLYLTSDELDELYKEMRYHKIALILVQSEELYSNEGEKSLIVDKDLCLIY